MTIKMPTTPTDIMMSGCLTKEVVETDVSRSPSRLQSNRIYAGGSLPRTRYTNARISATAR
jgi:hypothetical protein